MFCHNPFPLKMSKLINLLHKNYKGDFNRFSSRLIFLAETVAAILAICISIDTAIYYGGTSVVFTPRIALFGVLIFLSWIALSRMSSLSVLPRTQRYRTLIFRFSQISFIELLFCLIIWGLIGVDPSRSGLSLISCLKSTGPRDITAGM